MLVTDLLLKVFNKFYRISKMLTYCLDEFHNHFTENKVWA